MNPLLPGHSGTTPEPSRNALNTSQGTNEDDSQNDPRPEAGLFHGQMTQNSGPEDGHDTHERKLVSFHHWQKSELWSTKHLWTNCSELLQLSLSKLAANCLKWDKPE